MKQHLQDMVLLIHTTLTVGVMKTSMQFKSDFLINEMIGPYVLPMRLTAQGCLAFVNTTWETLMDNEPLAIRRDMWNLHNGAPAHYAAEVKVKKNFLQNGLD